MCQTQQVVQQNKRVLRVIQSNTMQYNLRFENCLRHQHSEAQLRLEDMIRSFSNVVYHSKGDEA